MVSNEFHLENFTEKERRIWNYLSEKIQEQNGALEEIAKVLLKVDKGVLSDSIAIIKVMKIALKHSTKELKELLKS